jgi:conjugal transfer pilus assembly protein TraB
MKIFNVNFIKEIRKIFTAARQNNGMAYEEAGDAEQAGEGLRQIGTFPSESSARALQASSNQNKIFWSLVMSGFVILVGYSYLKNKAPSDLNKTLEKQNTPMNIQIASSNLDADKMWRNHFYDKLEESDQKSQKKLDLIEQTIDEQAKFQQEEFKKELDKYKAQIQYLASELEGAKRDIGDVKNKANKEDEYGEDSKIGKFKGQDEAKIVVNSLDRDSKFDRPKSSRSYIPETAYVEGVLLGGLAVSTSIGSSSEPVPVVIRVVGKGSLPTNFNIDLTRCKIMGSSYGDISSERAIIRAEVLSCNDPIRELIYTTKIAGVIHGDDGMNGIKGRVVQTSGKHLKNAMLGSIVGGFAGSVKGQDVFALTSFGAVNTKQKGVGEVAKEGALDGVASAGEKLADYYIKQAESMSPILLIAGGVKVDVVFTKGVYLGALDVQEKIETARNDKSK